MHPTSDKSKVIQLLEDLVKTASDNVPTSADTVEEDDHSDESLQTCLVVDEMGVVQELMAIKRFSSFSSCKDCGAAYVKLSDSKI